MVGQQYRDARARTCSMDDLLSARRSDRDLFRHSSFFGTAQWILIKDTDTFSLFPGRVYGLEGCGEVNIMIYMKGWLTVEGCVCFMCCVLCVVECVLCVMCDPRQKRELDYVEKRSKHLFKKIDAEKLTDTLILMVGI